LLKVKKEQLSLLEQQAQQGTIDLFYGDESGVSEVAYVPYGWQFKEEKVGMAATHGKQLNCFGLLSRSNQFLFKTTTKAINTDFVIDFLEQVSFSIKKMTVIVLDNARIHTAHKIKERLLYWQQRGLYIVYLPPYSPHLNIIERLWKELKARWLKPHDYLSFDNLKYAILDCLKNVGVNLKINFSKYC
jgi:transposase